MCYLFTFVLYNSPQHTCILYDVSENQYKRRNLLFAYILRDIISLAKVTMLV